MLFRNKTLLAKIESTYGVDPTPTGAANSILTSNLQIEPYSGPVVSRNLDRSTLGAQSQINTNPQVQLTFEVEAAGSGTATTATKYDPLIRACGFTSVGASPTAQGWTYKPLSTAFESVAFYFYHDGQLHKVLGARGNLTFTLTKGEIPRFGFTFLGRYATPTAATPTGVDVSGFRAPVPVTDTNTPDFTMGGSPLHNLIAESFTFDMGNNIVARNVINSNEIIITDRNMTGSAVVQAVLPSTKNWFSAALESHTAISLQALNLLHGTTAGNKIKIVAPAVQLATMAQQESDGLIVYQMGLQFTPVSGNDEVTIYTQ